MAADMGPPRVRLACRVGVTGHRDLPPGTRPLLEKRVAEILATIRSVVVEVGRTPEAGYTDAPPLCTVVSPLAEGADRLVAEAGLTQEYQLACPLPFAVEDYRRDFARPASLAEFDRLLASASSVLELDGSYVTDATRKKAYLAVGRLMLHQSDLVIAVWDPSRKEPGEGGTAQIALEARQAGIPVIRIDPTDPAGAALLYSDEDGGERTDDLARLPDRLRRLLRPPDLDPALPADECRDLALRRARYFAEPPVEARSRVGRAWRRGWRLFDAVLGRHPRHHRPGPSAAGAAAASGDGLDESPHYRWADGLANYYADLYRSSFLANYLLGALAVTAATLHFVVEPLGRLWSGIEVVALLVIVATWRIGVRKQWRERALDARLLAEQLRQLHYLRPLGRVPPLARPPVFYRETGSLEGTWMNWHLRAIAREAGMVRARFTPEYVRACRAMVADGWLASQVAYHEGNAERLETITERLHLGTSIGVGLTLVAVLAHQVWLAIVIPVWAAACHGIGKQGEFQRLVDRSRAMAGLLARRRGELLALPPDPVVPPSVQMTERTLAVALPMLDEVIDWRIVYRAHDIPLT
jgi:hypothetical protein